MLKLTARILPGLITVALGVSAALVWAEPGSNDPGAAIHRASPPRPLAGSMEDRRRQADDLLQRARRAMAHNDLDAASQLLAQSESLDVQYSPLHLGDTPSKLRRDLDRQYQAAGRLPQGGASAGRSGAIGDPFAGRNREETGSPLAEARGRGVTPLPPVEPAGPAPSAIGRRSPAQLNPDDSLLQARRALAVGDVRRASQKVEQAKSAGLRYGPADDTPEKVEAAISTYNDLMTRKGERGTTEAWRRQYARVLLDQADALARWQEYNEAERLATEAARLRVNYSPYDLRPEMVLDRIAAERRRLAAGPRASGVVPASGEFVSPATGIDMDRRAASAVYDPATDMTRNVLAADQQPAGMRPAAPGSALALFQQGEAALRARDTQAAMDLFRQAYARANELDPATARRLQDHLQMLAAASVSAPRPQPGQSPIADDVAARQQLLARQMSAEVGLQERTAQRLRETDPKGAVTGLEQIRAKVESAALDQASKELLLRRIDRELMETRKFAQDNRSRIDLEEQNRKVKQEVDREQQTKLDIQNKLAQKVDEFNTMMHDRRFAEAEVVAKQAMELDPQNPLAQQLVTQAKMIRHFASAMDLKEQKEEAVLTALDNVEKSSLPFDDSKPMVYPDAKQWQDFTQKRAKYAKEQGRKMSERELEIQQKLKTPVSVQFESTALAKVIDHLGQLAGVNFYLDPQGLAEQGVSTDTPVSIDLRHEIKLESALNLILQPLHLGYVIKDDVLKVTSEQYKHVETYTKVYNVADLAIPIPNFVPHGGLGLDGAYGSAMARVNFGGAGPFGSSTSAPLAVVASRDGRGASGAIDPSIMAQMTGGSRGPVPTTTQAGGPGGLGGATMADFDSLIELITTTIQPTSWDEVGGPGSIAPFETNLSLVVSQTQEVHEEIADLLDQLRRMQDLQVTIEVRFITLNDNFFERIGVDFDFQVNDRIDHPGMEFGRVRAVGDPPDGSVLRDTRKEVYREFIKDPTYIVGQSAPGVFTSDLDIPFTQGSFGLAVPQFGGFNPEAGASIGFAILSEIEAFFFINAAQGDQRTNVLQAPKVTLFNGQQAYVMDSASSPFVISVIPVVGDFAAAQQPVICILSEGTFLTVQAVVSNDKRYVRLTVIPFFTHIGDVETFTFEGTETTITDDSREGVQDQPNDNTKNRNARTVTRQGTTVQLPTFATFTVSTTVSVPDGGTVLLGGIKRLSEGRSEFGVPVLNKIPYLNRLFKNVGIGRETQSLMMMVTPRIIIQEEEEERLGIQQPST